MTLTNVLILALILSLFGLVYYIIKKMRDKFQKHIDENSNITRSFENNSEDEK